MASRGLELEEAGAVRSWAPCGLDAGTAGLLDVGLHVPRRGVVVAKLLALVVACLLVGARTSPSRSARSPPRSSYYRR